MSTYSVFLDHSSTLFNYYPIGDPYSSPDLLASYWAPWNDLTGGYDPSSNITDLSEGASEHRTQQDGAILELYFRGSSLTLLGEVDQCNFDIWLDGVTSAGVPGNGRLADLSPLDNTDHRMLLTVHSSGNGSFSFRGAMLEVTPLNEGAQIGYNSVDVSYGQAWTQMFDPVLGNYHETNQTGATVNMSLHQTSAIVVYGIRGLEYGQFNVTLDNTTTTYQAKSSFNSHSVLFAATDLDSDIDHQLTLTHIEDGTKFSVASINITTTTGGNPPNSTGSTSKVAIPKGTVIAVATVAIGLLVILILTTVYVLLRRRIQKRKRLRAQFFAKRQSGPSFLFDQAIAKYSDPVMLVADPRHSYTDADFPDEDEPEDSDDASYHFVRRPLLSTPSLKMPSLGDEFRVNFEKQPSDQSHKSRASSKRSRRAVENGRNQTTEHPQEIPSDPTDFLHLQDTSHSTDHSKESTGPDRHRSRVRFSTPALTGLFKQPGMRLGRRSYSRSSRDAEPTSPVESEPFTIGTSVTFAHSESTPSHSTEESMSNARDESHNNTVTDPHGFIPSSSRSPASP